MIRFISHERQDDELTPTVCGQSVQTVYQYFVHTHTQLAGGQVLDQALCNSASELISGKVNLHLN
jgi:hypothetical protein